MSRFVFNLTVILLFSSSFLPRKQALSTEVVYGKSIGGLMGQIQAYTHKNVHEIMLKNSEEKKIGSISIRGFYHNTESWEHLKNSSVPEMAGPHNRRVISTLQNISIESTTQINNSKQENSDIQKIVEDLKLHNGLLMQDQTVMPASHFRFMDEFKSYLKTKYNYIADFKESN